jgi:hypothetical protein
MLDVGFRKTHEAFRSAHLIAERDFVMKDDNVQRDWAETDVIAASAVKK